MPLYQEVMDSEFMKTMKENFEKGNDELLSLFQSPFFNKPNKKTIEQKIDMILEELQSLREAVERNTLQREYAQLTKEFDRKLRRTNKSRLVVNKKPETPVWIPLAKKNQNG